MRLSTTSMVSNFTWHEPIAACSIGLVISEPLKTSINTKSSTSKESKASTLAEVSAVKNARSAASGSSFVSIRKLYVNFLNPRLTREPQACKTILPISLTAPVRSGLFADQICRSPARRNPRNAVRQIISHRGLQAAFIHGPGEHSRFRVLVAASLSRHCDRLVRQHTAPPHVRTRRLTIHSFITGGTPRKRLRAPIPPHSLHSLHNANLLQRSQILDDDFQRHVAVFHGNCIADLLCVARSVSEVEHLVSVFFAIAPEAFIAEELRRFDSG